MTKITSRALHLLPKSDFLLTPQHFICCSGYNLIWFHRQLCGYQQGGTAHTESTNALTPYSHIMADFWVAIAAAVKLDICCAWCFAELAG